MVDPDKFFLRLGRKDFHRRVVGVHPFVEDVRLHGSSCLEASRNASSQTRVTLFNRGLVELELQVNLSDSVARVLFLKRLRSRRRFVSSTRRRFAWLSTAPPKICEHTGSTCLKLWRWLRVFGTES